MMKDLNPEQLRNMAQMAATMDPGSSGPGQGFNAQNMAGMADMMRDMPPEQLKSVAAASGMDLSPDMIKVRQTRDCV